MINRLPGNIPGLVRHATPCRDSFGRRILIQMNLDGDFHGLDLNGVEVDLNEETARAHVAVWINLHCDSMRLLMAEDVHIEAAILRAIWMHDMTPKQVDTLARLVLRLAGRAP